MNYSEQETLFNHLLYEIEIRVRGDCAKLVIDWVKAHRGRYSKMQFSELVQKIRGSEK